LSGNCFKKVKNSKLTIACFQDGLSIPFCYAREERTSGWKSREKRMAKDSSKVKTIPEFRAQNQLGQILKRVKENKERFIVSQKGEATAVILGYEDFLRSILRLKEPAILKKIRDTARRSGGSRLTAAEIEAEIRAAREERRKGQAS